MRKSIDGLCIIIQDQLPQVENTNALYLFCGRKLGDMEDVTGSYS